MKKKNWFLEIIKSIDWLVVIFLSCRLKKWQLILLMAWELGGEETMPFLIKAWKELLL